MKTTQLFHALPVVLVVAVSVSGCARVPPPGATDDLVAAAAKLARQAGQFRDEAQQLAGHAQNARNLDEMLNLQNQAKTAAEKARQAAREADALQALIDDAQQQKQVSHEVQRAWAAAEEADNYQVTISGLLLRIQKQVIHSSVQGVTDNILQQGVTFNGDAGDQQAIQWLKEIVAGSYCDLFVDTVATGEMPTETDVEEALGENAMSTGLNITGISNIVTQAALKGFLQIATGKPADQLRQYKAACEEVLSELRA